MLDAELLNTASSLHGAADLGALARQLAAAGGGGDAIQHALREMLTLADASAAAAAPAAASAATAGTTPQDNGFLEPLVAGLEQTLTYIQVRTGRGEAGGYRAHPARAPRSAATARIALASHLASRGPCAPDAAPPPCPSPLLSCRASSTSTTCHTRTAGRSWR